MSQRGRNKTSIWRTSVKRLALGVVAVIVALTWSQTGYAVAPCVVGRGLDPLDVLNADVRHNVWLVLDTSGSMGDPFDGVQSRIEVARDVLKEVVNELVDATGRPLFNWGIVSFDDNQPDAATSCNEQFTNNCVGLALNELVNPPACDEPDNKSVILKELDLAVNSNGNPRGGFTPNGIAMDQISAQIVGNNYVANLLPTQKNFVILVTDGDDTCECETNVNQPGLQAGIWTPTASPPFAASNVIPASLRGDSVDWSYTSPVGGAGDRRAANAGTKGRLLYDRLNPAPADRADGLRGGAFVISITDDTNPPSPAKVNQRRRANHMAWEASGAFYDNPDKTAALFAENREELKNRLRDAFARIGLPAAEVSLGGLTVGSVREVIPSHTNRFLTADQHIGDVGPVTVDTDDILEARRVRANHQNNVQLSTTVEIPGFRGHLRAHNIYEVTDKANPRTSRVADFTLIWDAGDRLQKTSPAARNILFNRRGELLLRPFDTVTAADLNVQAGFLSSIDGRGAMTDDDARDMVVGVIRGYRLSKHSLTGTLYKPDGSLNFSAFEGDGVTETWKLYDALAAPAIVSSPPRAPDFDPPQNHAAKYGVGGTQVGDGFYWDHFNRKTMVYLPTNGGMMHGFDGETGDEVFAYIPDDVLGLDLAGGEVPGSRHVLRDLVERLVAGNNGAVNHKFFLAGPPIVNDAFLRSDFFGDDQWHTVLTFGRARGGRFVTGLDVTDPLTPRLRFNKGNREGISEGDYDGLGETWSAPVTGNVVSDPLAGPDRVDQWVAFLGAGYGCNNANFEGHHLFALRVEDGSVYYRGQVGNDPTADIPYNALVAMPTLYNPHQVDVADNKDYTTRVYIGDVQGNIWKLVTLDLDPLNWTLVKFAELGGDQPITAPMAVLADTNNQRVYVLAGTGADSRVDATTTDFKFVAYVDNDAEGANTVQYPLGSTPFWEKPLNPEERVFVAPVTIGSIGDIVPPLVFFAASRAEFDPNECNTGFTSTLFALGIESGQAEVDLDGVGKDESISLGEGKVTGLTARDGNLYVSESGGLGASAGSKVFGDGKFDDELPAQGSFNIQVLVDSFRVSPF